MLEVIDGLPDHVVGVRAIGEVEDDDYDDVLVPAIEACRQAYGKVRLLYVLGPEFTGYETDAMWEDLKLGVRTFTAYEKIAIVTDATWVRRMVKAVGWMLPGHVQLFHLDAVDEASAWVAA